MAFRKRKKKRGKNPTVRANTASSINKEDAGEQGTTDSAAETGNEVDEAGGQFFKSVQNKRRKHQASRKKGLFSSSNRVVTSRLKQQKQAELKPKTESVAQSRVQRHEPEKMKTISKTSDRVHKNGILSISSDNPFVGM